MFILHLKSLSDKLNSVCVNDVSVDSIHSLIYDRCHVDKGKYFLKSNGRIVYNSDDIGEIVEAVPKLCGGKGGFGSMLRAIGAQIEKTTNREACRDLSGRRLRDINEEQRLKKWIAQQAEREKEREEKRKKKLEKLAKVIEPKHEFKDEIYDAERADLTEKISDAVEQGFNRSVKRKTQDPVVNEHQNKKKKLILDLEEDLSSDESSSNEESGPSSSISSRNNFSSSDESKVKPKKTLMDDEFSSSSEEESNEK